MEIESANILILYAIYLRQKAAHNTDVGQSSLQKFSWGILSPITKSVPSIKVYKGPCVIQDTSAAIEKLSFFAF